MSKLMRKFIRKPPTPTERSPAPPSFLLCGKPLELVPFCQWRSGEYCTNDDKRRMCIGIWEKGLGR